MLSHTLHCADSSRHLCCRVLVLAFALLASCNAAPQDLGNIPSPDPAPLQTIEILAFSSDTQMTQFPTLDYALRATESDSILLVHTPAQQEIRTNSAVTSPAVFAVRSLEFTLLADNTSVHFSLDPSSLLPLRISSDNEILEIEYFVTSTESPANMRITRIPIAEGIAQNPVITSEGTVDFEKAILDSLSLSNVDSGANANLNGARSTLLSAQRFAARTIAVLEVIGTSGIVVDRAAYERSIQRQYLQHLEVFALGITAEALSALKIEHIQSESTTIIPKVEAATLPRVPANKLSQAPASIAELPLAELALPERDPLGYDIAGFSPNSGADNGYARTGGAYNNEGYNSIGCNAENRNRAGQACAPTPPVFSFTGPYEIYENSPPAANLGISVHATDPNGDSVRYSISQNSTHNSAAIFTLDPTTGAIGIAAGLTGNYLDYDGEDSNGASPLRQHSIVVEARDNSIHNLASTAEISIHLTDINEAPSFTQQSYAFTTAEYIAEGREIGRASASDPEGDTLVYRILTPTTPFSIDSNGAISLASEETLHYNAEQHYDLRIEVHEDQDPALSARVQVSISVTNVNEEPVFSMPLYSFTVSEDITTSIGTVSASDPDLNTLTYNITHNNHIGGNTLFAIDSESGAISLASGQSLNYDLTQIHIITVEAHDGKNPPLTASTTVIINVKNL